MLFGDANPEVIAELKGGFDGTDQIVTAEQLAALEEANLEVIAELAKYAGKGGFDIG